MKPCGWCGRVPDEKEAYIISCSHPAAEDVCNRLMAAESRIFALEQIVTELRERFNEGES